MRPATFEPEQIITAGEALLLEGRSITGFALRSRVGGGRPERLKQIWDEHIASLHEVVVVAVADLPADVEDTVKTVSAALGDQLLRLAVELNDKAVKAAERRTGEITRAAGEQTAQAERELADAATTVDELEEKLDAVNDDLLKMREELQGCRDTVQAQAVELATLRERLAAAGSRLEGAESQKAELKARFLQLESEMDSLATQHSETIITIKEQHAGELATFKESHSAELRSTSAHHAEMVEELKVRAAAAEHSAQVATEQSQAGIAKLEKQYLSQAASLNAVADNAVKAGQATREEKAVLSGELLAMKEQVKDLSALLAKAGQKNRR